MGHCIWYFKFYQLYFILYKTTDQIPKHNIYQQVMSEMNQTKEQLVPQQGLTINPIEQLQLQVNKNDEEDYNEVQYLLTNILTYPSTEMAELHMDANRLGVRDLRKQREDNQEEMKKGQSEMQQKLEYCQCCGYVKQTDEIKICTRLVDINNIGISTFLYFQTIKNIVILLLLMTFIYSIYALATNVIATGKIDLNNLSNVDQYTGTDVISISVASKEVHQTEENKTFYYIQCWIGVGLVLVWTFAFFIMKYFEKAEEVKVEEETISASDFSIVIQGIPKDVTQEQLQTQLNDYFETINNVPVQKKKPLKIAKFNVGKPFYLNADNLQDDELDQLKTKLEQLTEVFKSWVEERQDSPTFSTTKDQRQEIYNEYTQTMEKLTAKYEQLSNKVEEQMKKESQMAFTTVFVTFQTSFAMKMMAILNDPSFLAKLRYYITCCQGGNRFKFIRDDERISITIQRAPQPEDIKWENLGVSDGEIYKRKFLTYFVTLILLGISFAAVYGLSLAQIQNQDNWILSIVISAVISIINVIMGVVIRKLSLYEMDYTETNHQASLAIKSVLAQLINSILTPMIVNILIKTKVYERGGLVDDIFMLGVTNSFISPVLKIVDPGYIINRITKWFKSQPNSKITSNQQLLNQTSEYIIFESGYQYIYVVNLFLFTCFFVSLQPIISVFAVVGLGIMYWAQKYSMFNRMQRPVPGTDLINVAMWQLIFLGGIFYAFGSLLWSNILEGGIPQNALVPNLVAMGIGIVMALLPYRAIFALVFEDEQQICHEYASSRMYFPSEYDRLNPITQKQGYEDYMNFIKSEQEKFQNASQEEKKAIQKKFLKQGARGHQKQHIPMLPNTGFGRNPFMPPPQMMRPQIRMPPPQRPPMQHQGPPMQQQGPPVPPPPPQRQGFAPPGFGRPPPGFGRPPPGFGAPPPGFGRPPPGFGAPPPGFG